MTKTLFIVLIALFISIPSLSQEKTSGLLERNQIDEKYKWDTKDIYENKQAWENDFNWIEQNVSGYKDFSGKLDQSANVLLDCFQFDEKVMKKLGFVQLYVQLNRDVDMRDEKYQKMWAKFSNLESKVKIVRSFIEPELIFIPKETIQKFTDEESELQIYTHYFKSLGNKKDYTLSKDKEDILARASKLVDNPYSIFGSLVYAELPFPVIQNDKGEDIQLNRATSWRARSSSDRNYRKKGYQEYYKSLAKYKATFTKNLNSLIDGKVFLALSRNYNNTLEASLARYDIPVEVYFNLIESVKKNLQPLHRWMKMKKKLLKLDTLYIYDTRVSMFASTEKEYTWEEGRDLTLKSLEILDDNYLAFIKDAYTNRWIDAYPSPGKETGGYSSGCGGPHPYVKMNWGGKLFDFYTLVHELGHYIHASKTMKAQPFIYQDYPSFLSEVASTTAENVSQFYLISNSESKAEKFYQIEQYLDNVTLYISLSTMMAEFELKIYQIVENGEPLSADDLCDLYGKLLSEYYGDDVTITGTDKYGWLEWPHYYLDYYLYSYATSFSAAIQLASNIVKDGQPAVEKFNQFLEAGSSDYPVEVLKKAGVDMTKPQPYEAVSVKMNELMDEIEKMLKK